MGIEYSEEESAFKKHKYKLMIFGIFVVILLLLFYTSFFRGGVTGSSITGSIVDEGNLIEGVTISAELNSVPNLSLDGEFSSVIIRGGPGSFFYAGGEKFPLSNSQNSLILNNYNGEILLEENKISKLKGKASQVSVNNIPVFPKSGETMKISLDADFEYYFLNFQEEIFIKEIDYTTSGKILLSPRSSTINLDNDSLLIKKFTGKLEIINGKLTLRGNVEQLGISGEQDISVNY